MIIGIQGKIASGKSEVLKILGQRGYYCIDADKIVHDLYKSGGVGAKKVEAYFGRKFLKKDGAVDRVKLRNEVFANDDERRYLENLIHPEVHAEIERLLKRTKKRKIAIESIYFDPDFLDDFVDELWWVERPRSECLRVLVEERVFSEELAEKVLDLIEKPENFDLVVKNGEGLEELENVLQS